MVTGKIKYINNLLINKKISCTELTNKYLDCIKKDNSKLNAYIKICDDVALKSAELVDKKIHNGEKITLLEGIPMALKDNISTKNIETTCCSKILKGYTPIYDAFVWKILKNQNAILLGKANMDEFAMGSSCETSCFGGAKNPHNMQYVAGGSSGGVASAVGGNLAVYAATFCNEDLKNRIIEIYNNDGPGFFDSIINTKEYQSIADMIHSYIPQTSLAG